MKIRLVRTVRERSRKLGKWHTRWHFTVSKPPVTKSTAPAHGQNGTRRVIVAEPVGAVDGRAASRAACGRGQAILKRREKIKRKTIEQRRRLHHQAIAA
jgi:hypothetical protein